MHAPPCLCRAVAVPWIFVEWLKIWWPKGLQWLVQGYWLSWGQRWDSSPGCWFPETWEEAVIVNTVPWAQGSRALLRGWAGTSQIHMPLEVGGAGLKILQKVSLWSKSIGTELRDHEGYGDGGILAKGTERGGGQATTLAEGMLTQWRLPLEALRSHQSLKDEEGMPRVLPFSSLQVLTRQPWGLLRAEPQSPGGWLRPRLSLGSCSFEVLKFVLILAFLPTWICVWFSSHTVLDPSWNVYIT